MSVSIIIPTYNRKRFELLIEHNINSQTYYNIKEIIILDDSDIDRPLSIKTKNPIRYYTLPRCSIGTKRNVGVYHATSDYICHMDTDDMYDANYISYSIFETISSGKPICGSADMNMYSKGQFYKQKCLYIQMLNEATMVFKKSVWTTPFNDTNSNEAAPFLSNHLGDIVEANIDRLMCCIAHDHNTVPKKQWLQDQYKTKPLPQYKKHLEILSQINVLCRYITIQELSHRNKTTLFP